MFNRISGGAALAALLWTAPACPATGPFSAEEVPARAEAWLKPYVSAGDFSGVVLIALGDRVVFQQAYGLADHEVGSPSRLDMRFRVASVSKTFTAAAIEKLVAEGKLRYADKLDRYVQGIPGGDAITIEQLLLHESGVGVLASDEVSQECLSHEDVLRRLRSLKPLFLPGQRSQYSDEGYFLLAAVIERITGASYQEYLRTNVFLPFEMKDSGTACRDLPEAHNAYGSVATASQARLHSLPFNEVAMDGPGSVFSTAADLYRWLRIVDTGAAFKTAQLKYPYGWRKRKYGSRELLEQSGRLAGFVSHVAIYPDDHIYAVVLSNVQSGFSDRIPGDLEGVLFGGAVSKPPVVAVLTLGERSMRQYAGRYHSTEAPYTQTLAVRDGQLAMHWGSDPFWRELVMTDGDTFFLRADYATVHFERDQQGAVHRMVWAWPGGARLSFEKDRTEASGPPASD
jgi:D-alanyl-D-alanine carboxypeptidase